MKTTLIALAAAAVLAPGAAAASPGADVTLLMPVQYERWDDRSMSVNEREQRLHERIERGIQDGRITDREARRLNRQLSDIEAKERSYLYDGRLSRRETDELHRDLDRLRDSVRQQARDEQRY